MGAAKVFVPQRAKKAEIRSVAKVVLTAIAESLRIPTGCASSRKVFMENAFPQPCFAKKSLKPRLPQSIICLSRKDVAGAITEISSAGRWMQVPINRAVSLKPREAEPKESWKPAKR